MPERVRSFLRETNKGAAGGHSRRASNVIIPALNAA